MKKTKLVATILTICLAISTLAYGVYAATNLSFTIGANIAFTVDNLFVDVDAFVYNAYNQAGNTRLGTTQTLSDSTSVTALSQEVMNNHDGLSVIDDTDLEWDLTGQNLYFNSSNIAEKMTFRVEVKNYTPGTRIMVTIAPTVATATALTNAGITGGSANASGNAIAYDGTTAETAVAEYTLALSNLSQAIPSTELNFEVEISKAVPLYDYEMTPDSSVLNLPWSVIEGQESDTYADYPNLISESNSPKYLVTWYDNPNLTGTPIDYEATLNPIVKLYGKKSNNPLTNFDSDIVYGGIIGGEITEMTTPISITNNCSIPAYYSSFKITSINYNLIDGEFQSPFNISATVTEIELPCTITEIVGRIAPSSVSINCSNNNRFLFEEGNFYNQENNTLIYSSNTNGEYIVKNSVVTIGEGCFIGSNLTSISLSNITFINDYAFQNCSYLSSVILGENLTYIGVRAFENTVLLTSLVIPNSVNKIGSYAFSIGQFYSGGLTSLTFNDTSTWYTVDSLSGWNAAEGGTLIDFTNANNNASNLKRYNSPANKYLYKL